jgi:hypothetical protein
MLAQLFPQSAGKRLGHGHQGIQGAYAQSLQGNECIPSEQIEVLSRGEIKNSVSDGHAHMRLPIF